MAGRCRSAALDLRNAGAPRSHKASLRRLSPPDAVLSVNSVPALKRSALRSLATFVLAGTLLAGCAGAPPGGDPGDPFEAANRKVHAFNKGLDTAVLRPASRAYGVAVPEAMRAGVNNVARNAAAPGDVINNILQGDVAGAATNTFRFALNTTVGVFGLVDVAGGLGLPAVETDFGQTLAVWGVAEGPYLELPLFGPSTSRAAAGRAVDFALDPLGGALDAGQMRTVRGARAAEIVDLRYRFGTSIDGVLYDSADSYAQSRLLYLQNRRFELGGTGPDGEADAGLELYEDLYAQ